MMVNGAALAIAGMTASAAEVHRIAENKILDRMMCSVEG